MLDPSIPPMPDILMHRLVVLSQKASSGEWAPGHLSDPTTKCNCRSILTENLLSCIFTVPDPEKIEERFRGEYPNDDESAANMLFVCELVNAFRSGRLVEAAPASTNTGESNE